MKKLEIFHILPEFAIGGAEKLVIALSNIHSNTHNITICVLKSPPKGNYLINELGERVQIKFFNKEQNRVKFLLNFFMYIIDKKPNIINGHLNSIITYLLPFLIILPKTKFFHTIHNNYTYNKRSIWSKLRICYLKSKKVKVITISNSIDQNFKRYIGNIPTIIIENGVKKPELTESATLVKTEIEQLKNNNKTKIFISVLRMVRFKNLELLINVFNNLFAENINAILLIVGDDPSPQKEYYKELIVNCGPNIYFLGPKSNIGDYLDNADAFCISSTNFEGLPIAMLEALSYGLPIITTKSGGVIDVIKDNVNGLIVNDYSEVTYCQKIKEFVSYPLEVTESIRKNNLQLYYNKYCIEHTAKEYQKIFST